MSYFIMELQFSTVLKHTRPGVHQDNIRFQLYIQLLCIVSLLREYVDRTSNLRGQESHLFISTQAPFKGVARATISRWVERVIDKAGIDVKCFKPHSPRAAASSHAKAKGSPFSAIMNSAGWTQTSTFRKIYDKTCTGKVLFSICNPGQMIMIRCIWDVNTILLKKIGYYCYWLYRGM